MTWNVLVLFAVMFIFLGSLFRRGAPKLCESESGLVCCDGYSRDQSTGKCISCKPGYFDVNCSQRCFYPTYGVNCQGECSCQKKFCNFSSGCNMGDVTNDSQKSKGFGYVTYSMFEDAEAAVSKIMSLDGRRLFVQFANKKKKEKRKPKVKVEENTEEESDEDSDEEKPPQYPRIAEVEAQRTHTQQELKYLRAKTLVIQGCSSDHSQTDVEDVMAKLNVKNIAKVKFPAPDRQPPCALVRFISIRDTNRALRKIDGKEVKGCTLKACQLSKESTTPVTPPSKPKNTARKARLIIRNLSFKVTTPEISWQERDPVYSADFQPGTHSIQRIVTAGVDKYARIWKVSVEPDGKCCVEFLSNLKRHSKSVNVCRFSPDGEYLATAGDDEVVFIWKLSDASVNPGNLFQDEDEDNKENWVACKIFRGHLAEIYDLCWSSDGKKLVSGSMDNTAIVWDVVKEQRVALFNEHKSFVQGVAMDPQNEYVATMSTDRSCRIFNVSSKNCIYNVSKMSLPVPKNTEGTPETKPKSFRMFHDDTMRSFFRRLCFSPDGEILIVPAGCMELGENKIINSTYLMSRHCLNKSPDGRTLLISSTDGYCTFIRFGEDELGELYTEVKVADSSEVKEEKMTAEKSSPTTSSVSSKSEEPVIIMDTDTSSGDLNLILETTNDAISPVVTEPNLKDSENSAKTDSINAKGAKTPSGMETTPSGNRKSESRQGNSSTPTGVKTVPEDGSKGTPSGQPRRIQFITLSNGKAS